MVGISANVFSIAARNALNFDLLDQRLLGARARPGALPPEAQRVEEGAGWGQAATQTGEGFDAIAGLGSGTDGRRGEIGSDEFAVGRQFARGSGDVAASQSVESAVAIGREVALDGGPSALGDGGGLDASDAAVRVADKFAPRTGSMSWRFGRE